MNFLTNSAIAKTYRVSKATVTRWLSDAEEGRNNLELGKKGSKRVVIDNAHNRAELAKLVSNGQKYKRNVSLKKFDIQKEAPDFYRYFSDKEVAEIYLDLQQKCERNVKFCYFGPGAEYWNKFYLEKASTIADNTAALLDRCYEDITTFADTKINVVDLGCGNAHPVKDFIQRLDREKRLTGYFAVDISPEICKIAVDNVDQWVNTDTDTATVDIENESTLERFFPLKSDSKQTNLILLVGNTIDNFTDRAQVLKNIRKGMGKNDLFVLNFGVDTPTNREGVNYVNNEWALRHGAWMLEMMGFDVDKCQLETRYDEKSGGKVKEMILDKDYMLTFHMYGRDETVHLQKGDKLVRWRHFLLSEDKFLEDLKDAGFRLINYSLEKSGQNAMVVLGV